MIIIILSNDPLKRYFKAYIFQKMYNFKDIYIIGITGSCGKTSTCLYIYYFLKKHNKDVCYIGTHKILYQDLMIETFNTTLEVDRLIFYLKKYHINPKIIVMEVSSHGINFARINCFNFNILALTNLGSDHLDYHLNIKNYHNVKKAFLESPINPKLVLINKKYFQKFKKNYKLKYYSLKKKLFKNYDRLEFDYYNLYLVYLILNKLGFKKNVILKELKTISLNNGRGEIIYDNNRKIVIDYAHHIESFEAILNNNNFNKVVIFGCGGNRDSFKRNKMGSIARKYCKYVIITEDNSRNEDLDSIINDITLNISNYQIIKNRKNAIEFALKKYQNLDIFILGKGDEQYIESKGIKKHFNDKECVLSILKNNIK